MSAAKQNYNMGDVEKGQKVEGGSLTGKMEAGGIRVCIPFFVPYSTFIVCHESS